MNIFLAIQIVDHQKKQAGQHQHLDHFQAGHILNIGRKIAPDGQSREKQDDPAKGRPEQLRFAVQPGSRPPKCEPQRHHSLHHHERPKRHGAEGQRRKNDRCQHQAQNNALTTRVQEFPVDRHQCQKVAGIAF